MNHSQGINVEREPNDEKSKAGIDRSQAADIDKKGTIKELLFEMNLKRSDGIEVRFDSLAFALQFVGNFTGRGYTDVDESLPLVLLKTVKLLYNQNAESGVQLFQYLKSPKGDKESTMEWRIDGNAPRNEYRVQIVNDLVSALRIGISKSDLARIEIIMLTDSKIIDCIARENAEILKPLVCLHIGDDFVLSNALDDLSKSVGDFIVNDDRSTRPINEVIYTYLNILPFLHFVGEYKKIIDDNKLEDAGESISPAIDSFCARLTLSRVKFIQAHTHITSINDFSDFFDEHAIELTKLVATATGLPTEREQLSKKLDYVKKVLHTYAFHEWGKTSLDAERFSVIDCIAALCTTRHQLDKKTNYNPRWHGQESHERRVRLFSQMEEGRGIEDLYEEDYIPHGISHILYARFCRFSAQFVGRQAFCEALLKFQIARLDKYAECLLEGIGQIGPNIVFFNNHCIEHAYRLAGVLEESHSTE